MGCSNCYNGCTEIVSDKCVKYTGIDVPILGIKSGDSLSYVEQALIEFLTSTLDGSGIKIGLPASAYCEVVTKYLPNCGDVTALTLFEALVKATCDIQTQVTALRTEMNVLNANYDIGCLTGVTSSSDTHDIVQAIITKLCQLGVDLAALTLNVNTNYVKLSEFNTLVANYLATLPSSTKYYTRMVPYTIVPYYGTLTNFSSTGAGSGDWEKIYLCNGQNGTPDLRGRSIIGTVDMGNTPLSPVVDPAVSPIYNVNYAKGTLNGANSITLTTAQMPTHNHTANVTDPGHTHSITGTTSGSNTPNGVANYPVFNSTTDGGNNPINNPVGLSIASATTGVGVSITNTGNGAAHGNVHPVLATYYIMYIP